MTDATNKTEDAGRLVENLLGFIDDSPSPWHVAATVSNLLQNHGFTQLHETERWQLQPHSKYFVIRDDAAIIAFTSGNLNAIENCRLRIIGSHVDSPTIRITHSPEKTTSGVTRLSAEVYGGPILPTFYDRDLGIAGRVIYKDDNGDLASGLYRSQTALVRIPSLAIHMNREVNEKGLIMDKQAQMPPILAVADGTQATSPKLQEYIAAELQLQPEQIISWELNLFDTQKGVIYGTEKEFFATSRIDNLGSVHASVISLIKASEQQSNDICIAAMFDHEEIGSVSTTGADGTFLQDLIARITNRADTETKQQLFAKSTIVSCDMAHAYNPAYAEAHNSDHPIHVNRGVAIKINANKRYITDAKTEAAFINICHKAAIPWQRYIHRANLPCGSTIGSATAANLGIKSLDIGNPIWSMHSIRESAGVMDHLYLVEALTEFYTTDDSALCE